MKTITRGPSLRSQMLMSAAAVAMGVALFGASSQAQAQTAFNWSGFYIGGHVGYGGTKFRNPGSDGLTKTGKGYMGGLQAGYNWQMGAFVIGAEADVSGAGFGINLSDNQFNTNLLASLRGRLGFAFDRIMIYGTGGAGLVAGKVVSSGSGAKRFSKMRPVVGAGVEYGLTNNLLVRLELLDYIGNKTKLPNEDSGGNNMGSTLVTRIGFSYKFGSPAAPVMAAAPPPPPPKAMAAKSFIVFFDFDRSNITSAAQATINDAVAAAKAGNSARITLTGHTDRSGSEQYNQALSIRRGEAVKAAMIRGGVPASAIVVIGRGESTPLVPTADGVREPQNRRVEIVI